MKQIWELWYGIIEIYTEKGSVANTWATPQKTQKDKKDQLILL